MNSLPAMGRQFLLTAITACVASWAGIPAALAGSGGQFTNEIRIVERQGTVEVSAPGPPAWILTETNQILRAGYRLRTGPNSRVAVRWSGDSVVSSDALTEYEIRPPHTAGAQFGLQLLKGILSFFHRDTPGRIRVLTSGGTAGVEVTEFVIGVDTVNNVERTT